MSLRSEIDLRRVARPGSAVIAETTAGATLRLTFDHVAPEWATATVPKDRVEVGDELTASLGPQAIRLTVAFEVLGIEPGAVVDLLELVVRESAVVPGADPARVERTAEGTAVHARSGLPSRQLPCRLVENGGGEVTVHLQAALTGGEELVVFVRFDGNRVPLRLRVLRAASTSFGRPSFRCRPVGVTAGTLGRLFPSPVVVAEPR